MQVLLLVLKKALPLVAGAALGFAYWHFLGCRNGCMITGHWYTSTLYGVLVGATFLLPGKISRAPEKTPEARVDPDASDK